MKNTEMSIKKLSFVLSSILWHSHCTLYTFCVVVKLKKLKNIFFCAWHSRTLQVHESITNFPLECRAEKIFCWNENVKLSLPIRQFFWKLQFLCEIFIYFLVAQLNLLSVTIKAHEVEQMRNLCFSPLFISLLWSLLDVCL